MRRNSTSTTCAVLLRTARFDGHPAVVALWQSTCSQARSVLDSTPGSCIPFDFPLFSPYNIYFQQKAIL